jgi:hypothetical protein
MSAKEIEMLIGESPSSKDFQDPIREISWLRCTSISGVEFG